MAFELPALSYAYNALEPHIDARTMEIHHSKHHNGYTSNLNNAIADTPLADQSIEDILKKEKCSAKCKYQAKNAVILLNIQITTIDQHYKFTISCKS